MLGSRTMRLPDFRESCTRVRKSHLSPFCLTIAAAAPKYNSPGRSSTLIQVHRRFQLEQLHFKG